jgi:hypothetical protein
MRANAISPTTIQSAEPRSPERQGAALRGARPPLSSAVRSDGWARRGQQAEQECGAEGEEQGHREHGRVQPGAGELAHRAISTPGTDGALGTASQVRISAARSAPPASTAAASTTLSAAAGGPAVTDLLRGETDRDLPAPGHRPSELEARQVGRGDQQEKDRSAEEDQHRAPVDGIDPGLVQRNGRGAEGRGTSASLGRAA